MVATLAGVVCTQCKGDLDDVLVCVSCGAAHGLTLSVLDQKPASNDVAHAECFKPGEASDDGTCNSDGWYRCGECRELHPNVRAEREEDLDERT